VILSPSLLEIYNRVVASAMGMQPVSGLEILLGVPFSMIFGESFFIEDAPVDRRVLRRCVVVGFSNKALEFGFTVPLGVVVRANAMMRGREGAAEATSVILETARNEDLAAAVEDAKVLGLVPAPRSEEARKASQVLRILSWIFGLVSGVMLIVSSIHITHTFLMLLTERRLEIAVYRAVGARLSDIRAMVFLEAGLLGIFGGLAGTGLAWLLAQGVNLLPGLGVTGLAGASRLFSFSPAVLLAGVACAELFALVGAWLPAQRAARMDPASVLS
jgi:ABC-type antimicrobial peptide transport system permease subunit